MFGGRRKNRDMPNFVAEMIELYDAELRITTETAQEKIAAFAVEICSELGVPEKVVPYVVEQVAKDLKKDK